MHKISGRNEKPQEKSGKNEQQIIQSFLLLQLNVGEKTVEKINETEKPMKITPETEQPHNKCKKRTKSRKTAKLQTS